MSCGLQNYNSPAYTFALLIRFIFTRRAHAGPPFLADDPEPVPWRHYEAYAFGLCRFPLVIVQQASQDPIAFALVVALLVVVYGILMQRSPQRRFSNQDQPRQTFFFDRPDQRSAYEFKFGLLAGNRSGFTLPVLIRSRNDLQNFASRSCSR